VQQKVPTGRKVSQPVNWAIWKEMPTYTIAQLAAILAKLDPMALRSSPDKEAYEILLLQELKAKRLIHIREMKGSPYGSGEYPKPIDRTTPIKREDAIAWAESKGYDVSHIK
jgi:hypothetical protein